MNIKQLQEYKFKSVVKDDPPVPYWEYAISPWNHPSTIALDLLREVKHYQFSGMSFTGAMGQGKTSFATVLAHHIHKKDPTFNIIWADDSDFSHIKRFVTEIPKTPSIIIFDDVTSSLKELGATEMAMNFKHLTQIRHIFNEGGMGGVPVICFIVFHYSLDLEKRYRNIVRNNAYMGFSNTERSNIDVIAPKDSQARMEILKFSKIYHDMNASRESFTLRTGGVRQDLVLDQPFRPCCIVRETEAHIILFAKDDVCNVCSKKKTREFLPAQEVFNKVKKAYGNSGIQALKLELWKRGFKKAITPAAASAADLIENGIFGKYSVDCDELVKCIYTEMHKHVPNRIYHRRKIENELNEEFHKMAYKVQVEPDQPISLNKSEEVEEDGP